MVAPERNRIPISTRQMLHHVSTMIWVVETETSHTSASPSKGAVQAAKYVFWAACLNE
jgi:hypothetical protein